MTGIEPALSAWEAEVLPLNYTRIRSLGDCSGHSIPTSADQIHLDQSSPAAIVGFWINNWTSAVRNLTTFGPVLLSDHDIRDELDSGRVVLEPYDPAMVQPSSVDVRLDKFFRLFDNHRYQVIDPSTEQSDLTHEVEVIEGEAFVLHPGEFVLGSTYERVSLPDDVAARLEGKSSLGRLGLLTHSTAGFVDPGFSGHVTLELSNVATLPILLWPGMKVGQLCFFRLSSPADHPYGSQQYGSRYQGQRGPTASRSWLNFHRSQV